MTGGKLLAPELYPSPPLSLLFLQRILRPLFTTNDRPTDHIGLVTRSSASTLTPFGLVAPAPPHYPPLPLQHSPHSLVGLLNKPLQKSRSITSPPPIAGWIPPLGWLKTHQGSITPIHSFALERTINQSINPVCIQLSYRYVLNTVLLLSLSTTLRPSGDIKFNAYL